MIPNLFGLGDPSPDEIAHAADTLIATLPNLIPEAVRDYFLLLPSRQWKDAGFALIQRGAPPVVVAAGLQLAQAKTRIPWSTVTGALTLASAAASAYHGTKRNQSIGWGLWWFTMGILFPVVTPVVGLAQGFAKRKEK